MSRPVADLELALQQLIAEHRKLLGHVEAQQAAMRAFDLKTMDAAVNAQEAARLRIATMEIRRKALVAQVAKAARVDGPLTLSQIAALFPPRADALFQLRDELKSVATAISQKNFISGKLAGAVLGHLNTVVRLLSNVVEKAGIYTKHGTPQVGGRIGVMDAVG